MLNNLMLLGRTFSRRFHVSKDLLTVIRVPIPLEDEFGLHGKLPIDGIGYRDLLAGWLRPRGGVGSHGLTYIKVCGGLFSGIKESFVTSVDNIWVEVWILFTIIIEMFKTFVNIDMSTADRCTTVAHSLVESCGGIEQEVGILVEGETLTLVGRLRHALRMDIRRIRGIMGCVR